MDGRPLHATAISGTTSLVIKRAVAHRAGATACDSLNWWKRMAMIGLHDASMIPRTIGPEKLFPWLTVTIMLDCLEKKHLKEIRDKKKISKKHYSHKSSRTERSNTPTLNSEKIKLEAASVHTPVIQFPDTTTRAVDSSTCLDCKIL
ncbi:hypothetical protein IMY05_002G0054100 [Salix suchowensis]|nr:hypothetical protein IMY05_002G0054100 [Salix suchowensis]